VEEWPRKTLILHLDSLLIRWNGDFVVLAKLNLSLHVHRYSVNCRAVEFECCIRTRVLYSFWSTRTRGPSTHNGMPKYLDSCKSWDRLH